MDLAQLISCVLCLVQMANDLQMASRTSICCQIEGLFAWTSKELQVPVRLPGAGRKPYPSWRSVWRIARSLTIAGIEM